MTSVKYAHLQVMGTISGKFHQNPLKTVGGDAETRICVYGRTHYYSPLRLTLGDKHSLDWVVKPIDKNKSLYSYVIVTS